MNNVNKFLSKKFKKESLRTDIPEKEARRISTSQVTGIVKVRMIPRNPSISMEETG
jgi:hypothetical protein